MLAVLSSLGYAPGGAPLRVHAQRSSRISLSPSMAGSLVVTDGTDSFFGSRLIVQTIWDHGAATTMPPAPHLLGVHWG